MTTKRPRPRRPVKQADPDSTVTPDAAAASAAVAATVTPADALDGDDLTEAILRFLRRVPNGTVDLLPLAEELRIEPFRVQLHVERLARQGMLVAPFIEPGPAGGGTLTERGLRWLLAREGGRPSETPTAFKMAEARVRAEDEAARLPRSEVYGVRRN